MKKIEFTDDEVDVMTSFCYSYSATNLPIDVIERVQKKFAEANK